MNTNDILTLAKAGFTAQQIAALSMIGTAAPIADTTAPTANTGSVAPSAPQTTAPTAPPTVQAPATAPTATPTVQAPATAPTASPTLQNPAQAPATADDVLKAMQQMMLLQTQQPKQSTAEDILAEIINPPLPNKEE